MPPRKRTAAEPDPKVTEVVEGHDRPTEPAPAPDPKAPAVRKEPTPAACPECFPAGPPEGAAAVGCEHGSWPL